MRGCILTDLRLSRITFVSSALSTDGILISVSTVPHCWGETRNELFVWLSQPESGNDTRVQGTAMCQFSKGNCARDPVVSIMYYSFC